MVNLEEIEARLAARDASGDAGLTVHQMQELVDMARTAYQAGWEDGWLGAERANYA